MSETVSVGQLRQNPTAVLRAVEGGERVVVTNQRRPVADLVPHTEEFGVSVAELIQRLRATHADDLWLTDLAEARAEEDGADPWE